MKLLAADSIIKIKTTSHIDNSLNWHKEQQTINVKNEMRQDLTNETPEALGRDFFFSLFGSSST